jgi:hypothetical protein
MRRAGCARQPKTRFEVPTPPRHPGGRDEALTTIYGAVRQAQKSGRPPVRAPIFGLSCHGIIEQTKNDPLSELRRKKSTPDWRVEAMCNRLAVRSGSKCIHAMTEPSRHVHAFRPGTEVDNAGDRSRRQVRPLRTGTVRRSAVPLAAEDRDARHRCDDHPLVEEGGEACL